jgi:3-oxoacyl-[acyl-carrier-protein] synthase III
MKKALITALANYVPDNILSNKDLELLVETNDAWIQERSGIKERRILKDPEKAVAFMGAEVCRRILAKRGIGIDDIDLILVCTATPEYQFPATANVIGGMLGATKPWGFDLMAGCSGFVYALWTASRFIESGSCERILVVGTDKMSGIVDYTDRNTCVLFGDAAAGVLLEASDSGNGVIDAKMYSDGSGAEVLNQIAGGSLNPASSETLAKKQHFIRMDGKSVFKVAVSKMADVAAEMMERNNLASDQVDWLVPHQANLRIIEATANRMGLGMERVMVNIDRFGNTTCASIPNCLVEWEDKLKPGDNIILTAFGAGYTWGGVYLKWGKTFSGKA